MARLLSPRCHLDFLSDAFQRMNLILSTIMHNIIHNGSNNGSKNSDSYDQNYRCQLLLLTILNSDQCVSVLILYKHVLLFETEANKTHAGILRVFEFHYFVFVYVFVFALHIIELSIYVDTLPYMYT